MLSRQSVQETREEVLPTQVPLPSDKLKANVEARVIYTDAD